MTPRSDTDVCLDQLSAPAAPAHHSHVALGPAGAELGSPSRCGSAQVRGRVLLTVDDVGTPRLRLELGQAFAQLVVRTDGMAVLKPVPSQILVFRRYCPLRLERGKGCKALPIATRMVAPPSGNPIGIWRDRGNIALWIS